MARAKADRALSARRTEDILRIRLDGAQYWDVCEFVTAKSKEEGSAWFLAEGESPLSESQIRRYQQRADDLIYSSHERSRKKLFRRHLAQRRNLYARAATSGEIRTALAVLQDEAALLGLYDVMDIRDLKKDVERLRKQVADLAGEDEDTAL